MNPRAFMVSCSVITVCRCVREPLWNTSLNVFENVSFKARMIGWLSWLTLDICTINGEPCWPQQLFWVFWLRFESEDRMPRTIAVSRKGVITCTCAGICFGQTRLVELSSNLREADVLLDSLQRLCVDNLNKIHITGRDYVGRFSV